MSIRTVCMCHVDIPIFLSKEYHTLKKQKTKDQTINIHDGNALAVKYNKSKFLL